MPHTLLVIGMHVEELAFGKRVAEGLELPEIQVLCIDHGLPHDRSYYGNFYYSLFLRELYLQLHQQVIGKYGLVIDLHSGVNEKGRYAEIYCKEVRLLDVLRKHSKAAHCRLEGAKTDEVQLFQIISDTAGGSDCAYPASRCFIPGTVWGASRYVYVGLEIFLSRAGEGNPEEWCFARQILSAIHHGYRQWRKAQ